MKFNLEAANWLESSFAEKNQGVNINSMVNVSQQRALVTVKTSHIQLHL